MQDLSRRRAAIKGIEAKNNLSIINADVPPRRNKRTLDGDSVAVERPLERHSMEPSPL